jgi:hypothetical protein
MRDEKMWAASRSLAFFSLAFVLVGCDQTVSLRGTVRNVQGETLPGVAVTLLEMGRQSITDGRGRFGEGFNALRCAPGVYTVDYIKTGYTSGQQQFEAPGTGSYELPEVRLWPLPKSQGVYLFENYRYRETARTEPKEYIAEKEGGADKQFGSGLIFGTKKMPELVVRSARPQILCYLMPDFDVRLYRLERATAALPIQESIDGESVELQFTESVLAPAASVPIIPGPIDEPAHILLELQLTEGLISGNYAVHWGALDGHSSTDSRIFLFRVDTTAVDGD